MTRVPPTALDKHIFLRVTPHSGHEQRNGERLSELCWLHVEIDLGNMTSCDAQGPVICQQNNSESRKDTEAVTAKTKNEREPHVSLLIDASNHAVSRFLLYMRHRMS